SHREGWQRADDQLVRGNRHAARRARHLRRCDELEHPFDRQRFPDDDWLAGKRGFVRRADITAIPEQVADLAFGHPAGTRFPAFERPQQQAADAGRRQILVAFLEQLQMSPELNVVVVHSPFLGSRGVVRPPVARLGQWCSTCASMMTLRSGSRTGTNLTFGKLSISLAKSTCAARSLATTSSRDRVTASSMLMAPMSPGFAVPACAGCRPMTSPLPASISAHSFAMRVLSL